MPARRSFLLILTAAAMGLAGGAPPPAHYDATLCRIAASRRLPELRPQDLSRYRALLQDFYEPYHCAQAWIREGRPTPQAEAIIEALRNSDDKGLNPEDYGIPSLRDGDTSEAARAEFDLALTISVIRYVSDLHFGKVNPGYFHHGGGDGLNVADFIRRRLINNGDVNAALEEIEPPYPGYQRMLQALRKYLAINREASIVLPPLKKTIEPGDLYPAASQLAVLLRRFEDLPAETGDMKEPRYDGPLVEAVRHFQLRHGLEPDGRIGKATLALLNTPVSRRIRQLQLTLERWRWAPHNLPQPLIVVNIPGFELRAMTGGYRPELEMKVIVGKSFGHQTPVFSADMKQVIFRPYWDVPIDIQSEELVPKLEEDRSYLAKNRFEVVNSRNRVVSDSVVNEDLLARLRTGELRMRQIPGPENSLGLVKFLFPNPYDIYLHATPATELFAKSRRDFSHGCIRAEKPVELAAWVLKNQPGWTPERIAEVMQGNQTVQVNLDRPIPILIIYATSHVFENGDVHFFDDIYGQDARLEKLLAKSHPNPPRESTSGVPGPRPHE